MNKTANNALGLQLAEFEQQMQSCQKRQDSVFGFRSQTQMEQPVKSLIKGANKENGGSKEKGMVMRVQLQKSQKDQLKQNSAPKKKKGSLKVSDKKQVKLLKLSANFKITE